MKDFLKRLCSIVMAVCFLAGVSLFSTFPQVMAEGKFKYLLEVNNAFMSENEINIDETFYDDIIAKYDSSYGTEENALILSTPGQLMAFLNALKMEHISGGGKDFSGKFVKLGNDIDLEGVPPTIVETPNGEDFSIDISGKAKNIIMLGSPNEVFQGTFDGNSKKILNMVTYSTFGALFESNNGTIKNLGISGNSCIIASGGGPNIGVLAASNTGIIENCYSEANIYIPDSTGSYNSGGLVALNSADGQINNCYTTTNIYGAASSAGGICGDNEGDIKNSFTTGDIYTTLTESSEIGDIATSDPNNSIINCYSNSDAILSVKNATVITKATHLTAAQMTGESAKTNMLGFADIKDLKGNLVWKFVADDFPQLASFSAEETTPINPLDSQSADIKGTQTSVGTKYKIEIEWGGKDNNGLNFVYDRGVYNTENGKLEAQNNNIEAGSTEGTPNKWYGFDGINNKVKVTNFSNAEVKVTADVSKNTQANTAENIEFKLYFDSDKNWDSDGATAQQLTGVSHTDTGNSDEGKTMMTYGSGKNINYTMPEREFNESGSDTGKDTSVGFFVNISGEPGSQVGETSTKIGTITLNFIGV